MATASVPRLTTSSVLAWRCARQHLARRAPAGDLVRVVSEIAGVHAQVASSAELTLWARLDDLRPGVVDDALWRDRTLVRTWAMRGTLHLLPAAELTTYVGAQERLPPRHHTGSWLRHHGLERETAEAMLDAIREVLGGPPLTREGLAREVARRVGVDDLEQRLRGGFGDLLKPAAFRGDLVFAPSTGQKVRFTRPDRWLGAFDPGDAATASNEVTRRYLAAYGPATREDLARWFGMRSAAEAGRWIRELGDEVVEVQVDGADGWMLAEHLDEARAARPSGLVRLLPAFDHYVVAAPRSGQAGPDTADRSRVYRPQGWLSPVLLVDGRIAGVWRHEGAGGAVRVTVEPFDATPAPVRAAVEVEAERLGAFLGGSPEVVWIA